MTPGTPWRPDEEEAKPEIVYLRAPRPDDDDEPHHGGSWKVAYADFITAMMAFFLVMWIIGLDGSVRGGIQEYFQDPDLRPVGFTPEGRYDAGIAEALADSTLDEAELLLTARRERSMQDFADRLWEELRSVPEFGALAERVAIVMNPEGVRVELSEAPDQEVFFSLSSAELRPSARNLLEVIAPQVQRTGQMVAIEGHTDARPFPGEGYTNWDLSAERANRARQLLVEAGVDPTQIAEVRGYAARQLADPDDPEGAINRRISILVYYPEAEEEVEGGN
jgi:chemotaxis protein MotB